ncbi:ATP synthase epsilon chain [Clostridium pasteurianum DSM 525 = ATCC 6013]|uniref:ATP synthase epsilon chain n=1 Tax=Clostridium pasteurianum DSM 525 = ATCC 6013 TaxID=1262449 RepID=A0A0H3JAK2_CLOPA|nr:F0F1 ATP synthase subunit epsilon [Clostridium pasteurianum]AJA49618.1 ATP synthase epsilon chain [Clostridium pasteurianum DSM 525 = ATCC 6013]AJA53606.1 ATP synthase epsilon chain [Clostridium pasteurianum DSM 525 = ATCC 6013]AOZ76771.1 ATP synthase F0F1 subunit epsilon [Clostridium pasteurianum DSM 525 = ATCC 6013]AOZ80568.1 ATP synthase F0F1 subunit epsilon [Clostridium pasteurianum]ELP58866.1 F0F1 ATP synthase subunit epsilon [Clostridium pasteurianum DSM 525 = ATCC 6013]
MSSKIKLNILTPMEKFYEGDVSEVNTSTTSGGIGILPQHSPFIGLLIPTVTKLKFDDGSEKSLFTSTGILQVTKEEIKIIVDDAEWPEDIDIDRAEKAKERAEERLHKNDPNIDARRAEIALQRAIARMKTKGM